MRAQPWDAKKAGFEAIVAQSIKVYSQSTPFRDYNGNMTTARQMDVREFRKHATGMAGEWIVEEDTPSGTYTVRCGDVELCTVNGRRPRRFRSLDRLKNLLKEEIGVTEFRVQEEKT